MPKMTVEERRRFAEALGRELARKAAGRFHECRRILTLLADTLDLSGAEREDMISACQAVFKEEAEKLIHGL